MIEAALIETGKTAFCRSVLDDLPEWFGIAEARDAYASKASVSPMVGCQLDGTMAGFASLAVQTEAAAEIHVMGVYRRFHRRGVGAALVDGAVRWAIRRGARFLTVKTLAPTHPDPHYAATRRFYEAMGFAPLEIFPELWGAENPCLLMVRALD
ncbi:MAG: GNAT family N-acetyltransferase [Sphingomonadales bacterium]